MKSILLLLAGVLCLPAIVSGQTTVGPAITAQGLAKAATAPAADPTRPMIGVLKRQRLGLTVRNVIKTLEAMKADGSLAEYVRETDNGQRVLDTNALAVALADRIASDNPEGWQDIDWEAVLLWLEKILELLAKYLPIFLGLLI